MSELGISPTTDVKAVWAAVLEIMKVEINTPTFKTWLENTHPIELLSDGVFVIGVQNDFARGWLEGRYRPRLQQALQEVTGEELTIRIIVAIGDDVHPLADVPPLEDNSRAQSRHTKKKNSSTELTAKHTFDSFVVGDSNEFARNAAMVVAEQPGLKYNPLFIWGDSGLGKTHLLQAIGNYVIQNYAHKKVIYVNSEQFTNDFVDSISTKTTDSFRKKYRSADVLLIDDIQFLEKKMGTQEQFFHTFNELIQRGKAVVIASDRPAKDMNMDDRYTSRFTSGLPADIQPANYETRLAILKKFVSSQKVPFTDEILSFIAERSTSNIREMEGAVVRIIAYRDLSKKTEVDLDMAMKVTQDIFPEKSTRAIPVKTIQSEVCRYYSISSSEMLGSKRSQSIVFPRQVAMYLTRQLTDLSLPTIGREFGGRDHTTVMHARAKIEKMMKSNRDVYNEIQLLTNTIRKKG